jgi:hypothetical protein
VGISAQLGKITHKLFSDENFRNISADYCSDLLERATIKTLKQLH